MAVALLLGKTAVGTRRHSVYAALLLGYTIHFIYCIWGNLRITVAELIAAHCSYALLLAAEHAIARRQKAAAGAASSPKPMVA